MAISPRRHSSSDGRRQADKSCLFNVTNLPKNVEESEVSIELESRNLRILDKSAELPAVKLRLLVPFSPRSQYLKYISPDRRLSSTTTSSSALSRVESGADSPDRSRMCSNQESAITEGSILEALSQSIITDLAINDKKAISRLPSLRRSQILSSASEDGSSSSYSSPLLVISRTTMGCNRDKGSILARANERTRKQTKAAISREQVNASLIETYSKSIAEKSSREEFKATQKINTKRRKLWQKIIFIILLPAVSLIKLPQLKSEATIVKAANCIKDFYKQQIARRKAFRDALCDELMRLNFIRAYHSLRKIVRHWRAKVAVKRLKSFLTTCGAFRLRKFSSGYILRYVRAVKLVQGRVRLFLKYQATLLRTLDKLWDAAENRYVTAMVRLTLNTVTLRPINHSAINADTKLDKKWDYIESKFATFESNKQNAHQHKMKRAGRDSAAGFLLDKSIREPYLRGVLNTAVS